MCLPGARASAFRTTLVDTWIRVFGGDESLVDEIRQNRQIQDNLPRDHPGRAFGEAIDAQNYQVVTPDMNSLIQTALAPIMQRLEMEQRARIALQTTFDQYMARMEQARNEFEQRLQAARNELEEETAARNRLQIVCAEMSDEIVSVRSTQRVEYNAEAFPEIAKFENFLAAPADTAVRFKDLFRYMGIVGVEEEGSLAAGRCTRLMAPGIGQRKQRGRDGETFVTINYRKRHTPVMLRGIQRACIEFAHFYPIQGGCNCVCAGAFELRRRISDYFHAQ